MSQPEGLENMKSPIGMVPEVFQDRIIDGTKQESEQAMNEYLDWARVNGVVVSEYTIDNLMQTRTLTHGVDKPENPPKPHQASRLLQKFKRIVHFRRGTSNST